MIRRFGDLARGALALAIILILLVAVPWFLLRFGGLPGSAILEASQDELASQSTLTEQLMAGILTMIAWLCWAQVAYAIVVETIAAVRGRIAATVPLLPGIQGAAARLVATVALATSSLTTTSVAAGALPLVVPVAAEPLAPAIETHQIERAGSTLKAETVERTGITYLVGERETFWSIAEATLGDGMRWSEIRDANIGRTVEGGTVVTSATEAVEEGWELILPADAVPLASDTSEVEADAGSMVEVEPGDHFWSIAESTLAKTLGRAPTDTEIAPYWRDLVDANQDRLLPPGDPNVIYAAQQFELPDLPHDLSIDNREAVPSIGVDVPKPAPAPGDSDVSTVTSTSSSSDSADTPEPSTTATTTATTAASASPSTSIADRPSAMTADGLDEGDTGQSSATATVLGIGATAIGAGALALTLRRRRRFQMAKRLPHTNVMPRPDPAAEHEARIRPIADTEIARWVDVSNRLLSHRLAQQPEHDIPKVIAVQAGSTGIEMLLAKPCSPVDGFVSGNDDDTLWQVDPAIDLQVADDEADDTHHYAPGLATIGTNEAGELLLDLEQIGALSIDGDSEFVEHWYQSIITSFTTSLWAQETEIILIGQPASRSRDASQSAVISVGSDEIHEWVTDTVRRHSTDNFTGGLGSHESRVVGGDVDYPRVVLIWPGHDEAARALSKVASRPGSSLAVLAPCPLPVGATLHIDQNTATLEPYGLTFTAALTTLVEADVTRILIDHASDLTPPAVAADSGAAEDEPESVFAADRGPDDGGEPVQDVIDRILTPKPVDVAILTAMPTVKGLDQVPPAKQLSAICYLAFRRSVSSQRLRDTFWPKAGSRKTADNAISQIRRTLGQTSTGDQRLTQAINCGEYHLSDDIGCDWTRAERLLDEADRRDGVDAMALLRAALELADGQIGADAPSAQFKWLLDDPDVYQHIETRLIDAADRLGHLALDQDNTTTADWSAQQGLTIVPGYEAMYRLQMKAAAADGRHRAIHDAYQAAQRSAAQIGPWVDIEPETHQLWLDLTGGQAAAAS